MIFHREAAKTLRAAKAFVNFRSLPERGRTAGQASLR